MNEQNNKLFYIVIGLVVLLLVVGFGGKLVIDKITDRVIQKLQKEYSPSPYGPGFDPDKIDPDKRPVGPPNQPPALRGNWGDDFDKQRN